MVKIVLQTFVIDYCVDIIFSTLKRNFTEIKPGEFSIELMELLEEESIFVHEDDLDAFEEEAATYGVPYEYTGNVDYDTHDCYGGAWHEIVLIP